MDKQNYISKKMGFCHTIYKHFYGSPHYTKPNDRLPINENIYPQNFPNFAHFKRSSLEFFV